jgi:DNA-directed RNA polymerase alpha subunit
MNKMKDRNNVNPKAMDISTLKRPSYLPFLRGMAIAAINSIRRI